MTGRPPPPAPSDPTPADPSRPSTGAGASGPVAISSETLFGGASEVQITHRGSTYRLKQTALGKLILTK